MTAPRVLLASEFPSQYVEDTIVPSLRALGCEVPKIVSVKWAGEIRDVDAVAFMFQMCRHSDYDAFKARAKAARVPFVLLSRQSVEWSRAFRMVGVKLPAQPAETPSSVPLPQPPPAVAPPRPAFATFGAALRHERDSEDVTQEFIGELCGVSASMVGHWEADRSALAADCHEKLCELFPTLASAPAPEITKRAPPFRGAGSRSIEDRPEVFTPAEDPKQGPAKVPVATPLGGLLRAARALGIAGDVTIAFGDAGAEVRIGGESWKATTPEDACQAARGSLGDRLSDLVRRATEARALLGGGQS